MIESGEIRREIYQASERIVDELKEMRKASDIAEEDSIKSTFHMFNNNFEVMQKNMMRFDKRLAVLEHKILGGRDPDN